MPLIFGNTNIQKVKFNNKEQAVVNIKDLIFNGTKVFTSRHVTVKVIIHLVWNPDVPTLDTPTVTINVNNTDYTATFTRTRKENPTSTTPHYLDIASYTGEFDMINNSSIKVTIPYMSDFYYKNTQKSISGRWSHQVTATSNLQDFTITFDGGISKFYEEGSIVTESDGADITTNPTITIS